MVDHIGLEVLYSPEQGSPVADLVFVHGLGGHRRDTWTRKVYPVPSNTHSFLGRLLPSRKRKAITVDDELDIQASDQPENGGSDVFWPRDLLPKDLPNCRICTWGYNVDLNLIRTDTSTATVYQHAKNLLSDVADARMSKEERTRPLIFIAHSLGGIVLKDALNMSYKERSYLSEIFFATQGVCFLGTPHRGSSKAALAETLSRVTKTWGNSPNMQILQALKYDAETLDRVQSEFLLVYSKHPMKIRTFQEGLDYKGITIVDRFSSRIDIQGEMPVDIEANHVDMVKYPSAKDNGYIRVSKTLLRWVNELEEREGQGKSLETGKIMYSCLLAYPADSSLLQDVMKECLESLKNTKRGSRSEQVEEAFQGTLDWLYSDQVSFSSWLQDSKPSTSPLYWISGKPGSGKSTIMKYALNHERTRQLLRLSSPGSWTILSFFFHDRGSDIQKSIHGLMEELVYQLLSAHAELIPLICHIRIKILIEASRKRRKSNAPVFDANTKWTKVEVKEASRILNTALPGELRSPWSLSQLETAFEIIANQSDVPIKACLLIDALDEHSGDHERLLKMIRSLEHKDTTNSASIKICVSSRLEPSFVIAFASCPQFKVHHHTMGDIKTYARGSLESKSKASTALLDREQLQNLATEVTQKADGVFVWVRLVIKELVDEFVNGSSFMQLRQLLSTLPKELEDLYQRILDKRKPSYRDEFYLMCCIMLAATSPLSLGNLILAIEVNLTGQWSNLSVESMVRRLSSRSGGLIEVIGHPYRITVKQSDGVQFIHKTFKDFIRSPNIIPDTSYKPASNIHDIGCTFLLRASGYVLKYLNADERSGHENIYRDTFHYAAQLETYSQASRRVMIPLLEVLLEPRGPGVSEPGVTGLLLWIDKCATESHPVRAAKNLRQASPRSLEYDLAILAANCGGLHYVESKLNDGLLTEYPKRCALLWSVVSGFVRSRSKPASSTPRWGIDDYIRLLAQLVDRGARVGRTWSSTDELQLLLNSFNKISSTIDVLESLKMTEWLLRNGADPNNGQFMTISNKSYTQCQALWILIDKKIWLYQLWKLLLHYGADPIAKGTRNHYMLYTAIVNSQSKIAKLLCRAGADPTNLGQGINGLRPDNCTLAQFGFEKENLPLFVKNATQMQAMLRKFSNQQKTSTAELRKEISNPTTHKETVRFGPGAMESDSTEELSEESDDFESWEEPLDLTRQCALKPSLRSSHEGTPESCAGVHDCRR